MNTADDSDEETRSPRQTSWLPKIFLLIFSILLALAAAEVLLRIRGKDPTPPWPIELMEAPGIYVHDAELGFTLEPSTSKRYPQPESHPLCRTLTANEFGFREKRSFTQEDSRRRVCVLGDSFTFGFGVEVEDRFTDLVEADHPDWRLDNLGMTAYDPGLMLRSLDKVGRLTRPDLVVLCLFVGDLRRHDLYYTGAGFPIPRYDLVDGELVSIPYPRRTIMDGLSLKSRLHRASWNRRKDDVLAAILDRIRDVSLELEAPLAVVFLPGIEHGAFQREREAWLASWAASRDLPYLDLSEKIHALGREVAFIPNDHHYTPAGHAVVAEHLAAFIAPLLER